MLLIRKWRLIRTPPLPGSDNMAVDEALLQSVSEGDSLPVLRLYRWSPPTLTLGYAQKATEYVNFEACAQMGIEVVRRSTGGRAVLHECEVTYAVISPDRTSIFPGGILENYLVIAAVLQETLQSFGIEARLASGRERGGEGEPSVCFCAPSVHELLYGEVKMTGSAQRRSAGAFLQHGSIPVDLDLDRLCRALGGTNASVQRRREALLKKIGWMNRFLASPVSLEEVEERLIATFARLLDITFEPTELTQGEKERVERCKGRFEF